MKVLTIVGIVLIVIGVVALALQGITIITGEKVAEIGPLELTKEEKQTLPLSPLLGALSLAGGVILLIMGARKS